MHKLSKSALYAEHTVFRVHCKKCHVCNKKFCISIKYVKKISFIMTCNTKLESSFLIQSIVLFSSLGDLQHQVRARMLVVVVK